MGSLTTDYEWDAEEYYPKECVGINNNGGVVEAGEIYDHNFANKAIDALKNVLQGSEDPRIGFRLVLVRNVIDNFGGLEERSWAYVEDGKLPEHFLDAFDKQTAKVPLRFITELESAYRAIQKDKSSTPV